MSKKTRAERNLKFETLQLHVGQENPDPATGARAVPIYQTSSFVFNNSDHAAARFGLQDAGNIYGRLTNPTEDVFEQRMAALEGGVAALAVASGAAAINYTIINLAQKGDHIVSAKNIYGGSYNLLAHTLPQYGISTTFVDVFDLDEVRAAVQENTKAIYIETLGNPNSDVVDIEALAKIAHENKIPLVVDNTFATPYLVRPIEYGADIVVHSATKFIGGHGTTLGGVIVDSGKFDWEGSGKFASLTEPNPSYHGISFTKAVGPAAFVTKVRAILLRDTGATLSPFNSFLLLQGLETLSLRVERHVENALKVVKYLESQPQVEKVHHPSVSDDPKQQALYAKYFQETTRQPLRVGSLPFLTQYHLTSRIRAFTHAHLEIELTLEECEETELMDGLQSGHFDLVIARDSMISLQKYHFEPITEDRLCVMLPIDHPLAEKPALTIADLAAEPLILMHPYTSIYQLCMQLFEKASVKPQILRTARLESTISSVEIGEAFSLFAESNFELFRHPNVTAVPLLDAPPLVIGAAYPLRTETMKKPALKSFSSFIQDPT
jgi:O-acetylhomoserine (thiol)-lyase